MAEARAGAATWTERLGKSVQIGAVLVASLAVAFGILLLINSQAIVGNTHARNAHDLAVVADIVQGWPRAYGLAARLQYDTRLPAGKDAPERAIIVHPDLGPIEIDYYPGCPPPKAAERPRRDLFPPGQRAGEGKQLLASGSFKSGSVEVCYRTQVALQRLAGLARTAPELSNLIIVGKDKAVLVQVGASTLPITQLPPLSAVNNFAKDLAANITQQQQAKAENDVALESTGGAARTRISDRDYFAYVQPITVDAPKGLCPSAGAPAAPASGGTRATSGAPDATASEPCQLYAVGLMPAEVLRSAWLRPPPVILIGFGLALLLALALLPATRLLLIGGAESVSAAEVAAIVFGIYAAASVAALALIASIEVAGERALAREEAQASARDLAERTRKDLVVLLNDARLCAPWASKTTTPTTPEPKLTLFDAGELTENGTPRPGEAQPACSVNHLPAGANVSARQYFKDLQQRGDANPGANAAPVADASDYQFGQVAAQTDGINKTVVVLKWRGAAGADGKLPPHRYFLAASVLPALLAPVLPSPQEFMVVDTSSDELPVLFHQNRARAGIETFADQIQGAGQVVSALRRLPYAADAKDRQVSFTRRYDGAVTQFSAAGVPGSNWVVLIYHRVDDVDAIAAQSTSRALFGWASITLPAMLIAGCLLLWQRDGWRYLWPFRDAEDVYRKAYPLLFAGAAAIAGLGLVWRSIGPFFTVAISVGLTVGGATGVFFALRRRRLNADPLTSQNERDYRRFILAMITFVGVGPMTAFWADSRSLSRDLVDVQRQEAVEHAAAVRAQLISALNVDEKNYVPSIRPPPPPEPPKKGEEQPKAPESPKKPPSADDPVMNPWQWDTVGALIGPEHQVGFARRMLKWQTTLPFAPVYRCHIKDAGDAGDDQPWYCWLRPELKPLEIGVTARPHAVPASVPERATIFAILIGLWIVIYAVVYFSLRSLTGFGIPLGAVSWPKLVIGGPANPDENELPLASRSLLVAPQQAVRDRVCHPSEALVVDVADELIPLGDSRFKTTDGQALSLLPAWTPIDGKPPRLVVCGLELVLRDPKRRNVALNYLERANNAVSRRTGQLSGLVVIAEMSPLERILDAFDVFGKGAPSESDVREELRWARLFEDFTTFNFAPMDKVISEDLEREFKDPYSTVRVLVDELRWLPGNVVDAILASDESDKIRRDDDHRFPLDEQRYKEHYSERIINWSKSAKAITPEAAVDYIRANLIEHYEQCWAASSLAERVILDAIARNSYVNMRKAVALQSLVRRGLVIMDPTPRLMNRSFALYIRQAERPDTLAKWRSQQPRSPWAVARLPLAIVLPVLVIGVAMAAAESGQELTALFSLLAAGVPALVGTFVRTARGS